MEANNLVLLLQVKAGSFLNVACVLVMVLAMETWATAYLNLDTIPWATTDNSTLINITTSTAAYF